MKSKMRAAARQAVLYGILFGFTACGANSCSCDGFVAQEFPVAKVTKTIPTSGEIRVTSSGVQFLEDNLPAIVNGLVPGGLSFCVPPTNQSGFEICNSGTCASGDPGCDMSMTIDDASMVPQPPDTLDVGITIGGLDDQIAVTVGLLFDADCIITLHSAADSSQPAQIDAAIPITFSVDSASPFNDVRIDLADPVLDTSDLDFSISPVDITDFLQCNGIDFIAGLDLIRDLALGLVTDQFVPLIQEQIDAQLCSSCDVNACVAGTTCDGDNICRYGDGSCAQNPLGLSGELQIGTVLADFTERPQASLDMTVRAADQAIVNTGLTLGLRSGYDPVDTGICVPVDPTVRDFAATPMSPTVTGNATPFGQPFHFGLGYHKKAIEHMLWSVWGSGGTCLRIGTENIDLLTTGALGALLPSMRTLAYGKSSEAYIKIVPQRPPDVVLGANDVTANGTSYTVNDPLMTIDWKDFDIHIYAFAQDRFTRIVTIRMDLLLPIAIVPDGMGSIVPIIGDLETAFTNERIISGDIVAEDPARILDLLPTLIGFALPSLAGSISQPIEVPEFFGFRINIAPENITSVDNNTSIAIFADLEIAAVPIVRGTETNIVGTELDMSGRTPSGLVKPVAYVDVLSLDALLSRDHTPDIEYSYRVNHGTWSLFERTTRLAIDDPMLIVPGAHKIEVRGRQVGEPYTVDGSPAETTVFVDWEAPEVEIERLDHVVTMETSDLDDADALEMRYKIIDGETPSTWTGWMSIESLDLTMLDVPDRFRLDVEVRDRAGNVGKDSQTVTWRMPLEREELPPTTREDAPTAGCSATGNQAPAGLFWLLLAGVALWLRPRRRRVASNLKLLGLAAIVCFGACKCGDDNSQNLVCEPACAAGQLCVEGACVADTQCAVDEDCTDNERCVAGECVNSPTCEDLCDCGGGQLAVCNDDGVTCGCIPYCDKGCEDTEYCCHDSNTCEALPDPCADTMCEIGFGPVVTSDATADSPTCETTAGACECQELPPLPLGWHGHYAAIDRNGGVTGIAAFNSTYEDLMVGVVDASLNVTWDFVDGVPATGDVEGSLNGPRGGISDKGEDVGRFTGLAIDDAGNFHVFYREHDLEVLKYARGTVGGTWDISTIDTDGNVGYWSSAVHQNGRIHVVYTVKVVANGAGWDTRLRHLSFDATGSPADPTATLVDVTTATADHPCGADCEDRNQACVANLAQCVDPTNDCTEACADGSECYQGVCELVHEEPPIGYLRGAAANTQLSKTQNGLLVVYYDGIQRSAAWARFDGNAWTAPTLVGPGTGPWVGGMVDASDNVHLAYMEKVGEVPQLTYADVNAATTEMVQDGIRDTVDWWLVNDIGEDIDLRVAADGSITLVYQDATAHALKMATRSTAGAWTVSDVATPGTPYSGAHGFYATMLKLPDAQFSAEVVINNQLDPSEAAPAFDE